LPSETVAALPHDEVYHHRVGHGRVPIDTDVKGPDRIVLRN
jgi:hypothetical protein